MATRLFLRNTTNNTAGYAGTEKSTALPVGTLDDAGNGARDLETTKGSSQTSVSNTSLAQGTDQDQYMGKWISDPLTGISQIDANTWTLAVAALEGNNNANCFTVASVYVLTSGDTVRGFVYDSHTSLGVEYLTTEDGQVLSLTGSAVTGVVSTDRLCVEVWIHAAQSMAVSYTNTIFFDGTTDVVDSTTTDAASYLETPQNGLFSSGTTFFITPTGSITGAGVLNRQTNKALSGSAAGSGAVARLAAKLLTGTSTGVGVVSKLTSKLTAGAVTATGALTTAKIVLLDMAGTVTAVGNLVRSAAKNLVGTVTGTGAVAKATAKTFAGLSTPTGSVSFIKLVLATMAGAVTATGTLARNVAKTVTGSITSVGSVTKTVSKAIVGSVTSSGALAKLTSKVLAGAVTPSGILSLFQSGAASLFRRLEGAFTTGRQEGSHTAGRQEGTTGVDRQEGNFE